MLNQVAGITRVRMLYLQLHYRCNFRCRHCFHGDLLESPDALGLGDVQVLLAHFASGIGITVGATMTVTEHNLDEVVPLAQLLQRRGVTELKLHALRLVGNAARNQDLQVIDINRYSVMHQRINDAGLDIPIFYDADLSAEPAGETCSNLIAGGWLDRIEADPRGGLTISCKAVGRNVNAFRWDRARHEIVYEPNPRDELAQGIPDVIYQTAARN